MTITQKCIESWEQNQDVESLQTLLRTEGVSKLDAIKVTREICHVSLGVAKRYVNDSRAWADTRQASAEFEQSVFDALEDPKDS